MIERLRSCMTQGSTIQLCGVGALLTSRHRSRPQEPEGRRRRSGLVHHGNGACGRRCRLAHDRGQMPAKSKLLMQRLPCGSCAWGGLPRMSSPRRWQCRKRLAGSQAAVDGVRSFASMSVTGQTKSVRQVLVPCPHFTRPRVILGPPSHVRERGYILDDGRRYRARTDTVLGKLRLKNLLYLRAHLGACDQWKFGRIKSKRRFPSNPVIEPCS